MVSINELKQGNRYIFYEQRTVLHSEISYRGTFLEIRHIKPTYSYIYLLCDKVSRKVVSIIPLPWIRKIESMDDILQGKTVLCPDVLTVIDEFL